MKYRFIAAHRQQYPVERLCMVLGVSTSGFYAWQKRSPSQRQQVDAALLPRIRAIWQQSQQTYGSPRIHAELQAQGIAISRKRVARLMGQAGMRAKTAARKRPRTTIAHPAHPVFANRLGRDFQSTSPNEKWLGDITYIETQEGYLYLAGLMDLFSRKIVGLAMETHLETDLVEAAFHMAVVERQPQAGLLHHSDRGSQYTSDRYLSLLDGYQMQVSLSDTGQCLDNAPMESFWGTLKTECAAEPFATRQQARTAIFAYIAIWYNRQRRHSSLGYLSPEQFEQLHRETFS
jgi:transposase InsO family protein